MSDIQHMMSETLKVNEIKSRVAAQNMANSQSAGYFPKDIYVKSKMDKKSRNQVPHVVKVKENKKKVKKVYQPSHPDADNQGYVEMPDIDHLIVMMDMQQNRLDNEKMMRVYEMATQQQHRVIGMIG